MNLENYVVATEVAELGGFKMPNISMALKEPNIEESIDYIKTGGTILLNKKSINFASYIRKHLHSKKLSNLSGLIHYSYFSETLEGETKLLKQNNYFKEVTVGGKKFVKITDNLLNKVFSSEDLKLYILDAKELEETKQYIIGHIKLSNKSVLVWY